MTTKSALVAVLIGSLAFACIGALIGASIGAFAPDYYRTVFRRAADSAFNPIQIGLGLGVTQGAASGIVISIALIALMTWRDRIALQPSREASSAVVQRPRSWKVHAVWSVATAVCVTFVATITFVLGAIIGQQQLYQSWTDRKLERVARILESSEFAGVEADFSSAAQVYLTGSIKNTETREALRQQLVVTFGTEEAEQMLWRVEVAK